MDGGPQKNRKEQPMASQRISLDLNTVDFQHLQQVAERHGKSIRDYVAALVSSRLAQEAAPLAPGQALQRASSVVR
jgi:hypothetical protein